MQQSLVNTWRRRSQRATMKRPSLHKPRQDQHGQTRLLGQRLGARRIVPQGAVSRVGGQRDLDPQPPCASAPRRTANAGQIGTRQRLSGCCRRRACDPGNDHPASLGRRRARGNRPCDAGRACRAPVRLRYPLCYGGFWGCARPQAPVGVKLAGAF